METNVSKYFKYNISGKEYQIRYKTPTIGDQIRIGQQYAALKAGFDKLDDLSDSLAYMSATLSNVIVDLPKEIDFMNLRSKDWNEVRKMLKDYQDFAFFRDEDPAGPEPS